MPMDKYKRIMSGLFFLLFGLIMRGQPSYKSNMIVVIDEVIMTQRVDFEFYKEETLLLTHPYRLGDPLIMPKELFWDQEVILHFNCWLGDKEYRYAIDFKPGWITNTSYTIMKIYNLDKEKYKAVFCKQEKEYVVEIKNAVYDMEVLKCQKLEPSMDNKEQ